MPEEVGEDRALELALRAVDLRGFDPTTRRFFALAFRRLVARLVVRLAINVILNVQDGAGQTVPSYSS